MKKIDVVKVAEIGGLALSVIGTIVSAWAGGKKNERTIAKLVEKTVNK